MGLEIGGSGGAVGGVSGGLKIAGELAKECKYPLLGLLELSFQEFATYAVRYTVEIKEALIIL